MKNIDKQIYFWAHMLDECYDKHLLTEGKHWPEDYAKTAFNLIKQSTLGQQSWYSDDAIRQDVQTFVDEFTPLSHKSSNLGFFISVIRWFIEYSKDSAQKYQDFFAFVIGKIISGLLKIRNDKSYDAKADAIKKMSFNDFMQLVDEVNAKTKDVDLGIKSNAQYEVVPIYSYEELHERYGGDKTGYRGESKWCHTDKKSTYETWTKNETQMFFVIQQKDWEKIQAPQEKPDNCYDEYGISLIAILVDVATNKLLRSTSRWNHVVTPQSGDADEMFESWSQLNKAIGLDVENNCKNELAQMRQKLQVEIANANKQVEKILANASIIGEDTIPKKLKLYLTNITISDNVESIGNYAFNGCTKMTSITIPNSVESIGNNAFYNCTSLTSITIPNSVKNIGIGAFEYCTSLTSITIPNNVEHIMNWTFSNCRSLTNITIPHSVKIIGNRAFHKCTSLISIVIPDNIESIEAYAFSDCINLTSIIIPESIKYIGYMAFSFCKNLKTIVFEGKTLEELQKMHNYGYPWGIKDKSIIKCEA